MDLNNHIEKNINGLNRLARNLRWTWNQDAQDLFEDLSPRAWQNLFHNAVAVLSDNPNIIPAITKNNSIFLMFFNLKFDLLGN